MGTLKGRDVREVSSIAFLRQVERARNILSSDYCRTIKIWSNAFGWDALHIDFFDRLRDDPQAYLNAVLRHIGATTPWALPAKFMKTKVHATNSIVAHNREIPEVVEWYIADRLLKPTERLNELLKGRVSSWVDEMRTIRGKTRLTWRILREGGYGRASVPGKIGLRGLPRGS